MMDGIWTYGIGVLLISTGMFCLFIAVCILMERRQDRARIQEHFMRNVPQRHARLCWMCEKRPALPDRAECRKCRKVYERATQERIAA